MTYDPLKEAMRAISEMDLKSGVPESVYVIEECSELIKTLTKKERGKGNDLNIIEEACDVLCSVSVLLYQLDVPESTIKNQMLFKYNRTLERYIENGEV